MLQQLKKLLILTSAILCFQQHTFSQDADNVSKKTLAIPEKLFSKVNGETDGISDRITKKTEHYLRSISREERKLKNKLAKKDSTAAKQIFGDAGRQYVRLQNKIKNSSAKAEEITKKYIPRLDTLQTALKFLGQADGALKNIPGTTEKLEEAISKIDVLQKKFNQADEVNNYLNYRRQFLQDQLGKFGMVKDLKKLKKQAYYYQSQVQEYKKMMNDPSLIESKMVGILKETPEFRKFFSKHSQLSSMFSLPNSSNINTNASFTSLQTRDAVQTILAERFGSGTDVQRVMQEQVQGGRSKLANLKNKINQPGAGDIDMPDFKPNNQKIKPLKNRLEFGTNLQTVKSNRFFPSTSDIGLSLGYKLNDKSTIGLGGSYKVGWGKDVRHINISHQGLGMRSFVDYKIKGNIWLSGGGEINYLSQFNNFEILEDYSAWQKSALLGISKKYKVSSKIKGNAQLMYDFLWKEQIPRTQPLLFRIGYSLK